MGFYPRISELTVGCSVNTRYFFNIRVGKMLRDSRRASGRSISEISQLLGLDISLIEDGLVSIGADQIYFLARKIYKVPEYRLATWHLNLTLEYHQYQKNLLN
jgi:hypothetical protein